MELRHFRYLVAVSEEGTFVGAAEKLRLAQPALSRQIHNLEKELGTPVFERSRTGVSLTPAGAVCLGAARKILGKVDSAVDRVRLAEVGRVGACSMILIPEVACPPSPSNATLTLAVSAPPV